MTSVTSALIKVFESSGFECELIETEKEDQVRIPITGDTFGPRLMVVRFPHEGDYMAVFLPDLLEIPKGKASTALKVANELHRSSHLVKFWVDKKNRSLWAMITPLSRKKLPWIPPSKPSVCWWTTATGCVRCLNRP